MANSDPPPPASPTPLPTGDEPPPLLRTWNQMYILVLGSLAVTILLFTLLTRAYS